MPALRNKNSTRKSTRNTPYTRPTVQIQNDDDILYKINKGIDDVVNKKTLNLASSVNPEILKNKMLTQDLNAIFDNIMKTQPNWNQSSPEPEIKISLFRTIFSDFNPIIEKFLKQTNKPSMLINQTLQGISKISELDTHKLDDKYCQVIRNKTGLQCEYHNKTNEKKILDSYFTKTQDKKMCYYCGGTISNASECDHVFPVLDMFTKLKWNDNLVRNFVSTHKECNGKAKNQSIETIFNNIGKNDVFPIPHKSSTSKNNTLNINKCKFYLLFLILNKIEFVDDNEYSERLEKLYKVQQDIESSRVNLEEYIQKLVSKQSDKAKKILRTLKELTYSEEEYYKLQEDELKLAKGKRKTHKKRKTKKIKLKKHGTQKNKKNKKIKKKNKKEK